MEIAFDPDKAAANIAKHGVSFEEARGCLFDPMALVAEDPDAQGEVRTCWSACPAGCGC